VAFSSEKGAHPCRYIHGEKDINHMNLGELQALENNLEMWVHNIRSQKVRFMASCSSRFRWNLVKNRWHLQVLIYDSFMSNRCRPCPRRLRCSGTRLVQHLSLCSCIEPRFTYREETKMAIIPFCVYILQEGILQATNDILQERVLNLYFLYFNIKKAKKHKKKHRV